MDERWYKAKMRPSPTRAGIGRPAAFFSSGSIMPSSVMMSRFSSAMMGKPSSGTPWEAQSYGSDLAALAIGGRAM